MYFVVTVPSFFRAPGPLALVGSCTPTLPPTTPILAKYPMSDLHPRKLQKVVVTRDLGPEVMAQIRDQEGLDVNSFIKCTLLSL